jgi:uncharacterized YigZ family protein
VPDFLTIKNKSEGLYKEKGSKFIAYAYPIKSEADVRPIVKSLKKDFYDARHHCYAFIIGKDKKVFRAADDGEPSNSAGAPILGQIRSLNLTNVLVVVVRYFGGTKLGVPGLVNAYREAAKDALTNSQILEAYELQTINIEFDYIKMNDIMKLIKDFGIELLDQGYDSNCTMSLRFKKEDKAIITSKLEDVVLNLSIQ